MALESKLWIKGDAKSCWRQDRITVEAERLFLSSKRRKKKEVNWRDTGVRHSRSIIEDLWLLRKLSKLAVLVDLR